VKTEFASPERLNKSDLAVQTEAIKRDSVLGQMLDAMPNIILVLNRQRQVVFANQVLLDHFNITSIDEFVGLRPGEILNCIHSAENEAGCGTTEFCRECGAANAILNSQKNGADIQECRIIQNESLEALDLRINATRFKVSEEEFTIFAVTDISNEKRREVLEQLFFHDVLNTANGMIGYTELLRIVDQDQVPGVADQLMTMHDRLVGEIKMQRLLISAENGELEPAFTSQNAVAFMHKIVALYQSHDVAKGKHVRFEPGDNDFVFETDGTILGRVIGNMVKNALEACQVGDTVVCRYSSENGKIKFSVQNPAIMPREVQLQVFQRSFSTKGKGRGLGTYSMKMLSERYLHGNVWFTSNPESGTTFYAEFPLSNPSAKS